ncbi:MAG: DUF362 domain-containing protein [bacterium]
MKVAAPIASSFVLYLIGFFASVTAFKKARNLFSQSKYITGSAFLILFIIAGSFTFTQFSEDSFADENIVYEFNDPLGPNNPIGEAKGVLPGRVVWIHDPGATNESCKPATNGDGYFLDKNCSQSVVDDMFSKGIKSLTGKETDSEAWDVIFHYFNQTHGKGDVGYLNTEKIFIKINAVHAWAGNISTTTGAIIYNSSYGNVDTSPQAILAMLRQLVNVAGVPQENISIGDPLTNVFKHIYDKCYAEFPNIHYMSQDNITGREKLVVSNQTGIYFSDKGTVLTATTDKYFTCQMEADYILSIPAMKGHKNGGVTFAEKNFFGSTYRDGAGHLHNGLMKPEDGAGTLVRDDYKMYRIMVDLMANKYCGGKSLLYFMDGLWGASMEHTAPCKFFTEPFNNDWSSSLLFSLDPVAISSVGLDILQKEFTVEDLSVNPKRYIYVQWNAVDDFLHQAASSDWWPDGITYDPENDGVPIGSMGVHEHWNNVDDMQYTRNLGTGNGIELIKIFQNTTDIDFDNSNIPQSIVLNNNYPNPFNPTTVISWQLEAGSDVRIDIFDVLGKHITTLVDEYKPGGNYKVEFHASDLPSGIYFYRMTAGKFSQVKPMVLLK